MADIMRYTGGDTYKIDVTITATIRTFADDYKHAYSVVTNDIQDALKDIGAEDMNVLISTVINEKRLKE